MVEDREKRVRERAYALWEQEGRPEGRHNEHWHQARREIGEGREQQSGAGGPEEPRLTGLEPAPGESLEEIAKGEHQGP